MTTMPARMILAMLVALSLLTACAQEPWESYNDAGVEAYEQARYAEAEELYLAALEEAEKFGEQDPRLATVLNNLAALYRLQGKYTAAEPLHRRALAIWEHTLGPEHPDVATRLHNLASFYDAQGKYAEAEPLYQRSLAIWEKAFGPEHPNVALSLENYADLLRKTDRNAEADRLEARAKALRGEHQ